MEGQSFIFGLICFQIIYVMMQWYFFKRIEFLYYILYLGLFVLYEYVYYEPKIGITNLFNGNIENIKLFTRLSGLFIFYSYVIFSRFFTDVLRTNIAIYTAMRNLETFLLIGIVAQSIFACFVRLPYYGEIFSWLFYIPSFIYGIIIGKRLIGQRVRLNTYIIVGSLFAICGAFMQGITDDFGFFFGDAHHQSNIIMELGFVAEFVFLNIGFMYKNKLLQQQQIDAKSSLLIATLEKNEIANQLQQVRAKLAMDLHDDVNSSLGSIRIISEIMVQQLVDEKDKLNANKILVTIQDLSQKLNVIVWSIMETNDTLICFIDYTKNYTEYFSDATSIKCDVTNYVPNTNITLNGNIRKNLFLCIKEAMNNTLKHAKANNIYIAIALKAENKLCITIADDGIGLQQINKFGNGLSNMKKRMKSIGGTFAIVSEKGTCVILTCSIE